MISALPASGSLETAAIPAENTVIFCNFVRQRPDDIDAGDGSQLADLLEADFGVATRHDFADRRRGNFPGLVLHLLGNAELLKHSVET